VTPLSALDFPMGAIILPGRNMNQNLLSEEEDFIILLKIYKNYKYILLFIYPRIAPDFFI
jgi:hypothetical protein